MTLQWTPALAVGVEEIDSQHAELFERVERFYEAMLTNDRDEPPQLLRFLVEYVRFHFAAEERLMSDIRYPDHAAHEEEHAAFGRTIERLTLVLDQEGVTPRFVDDFEREVTAWLTTTSAGPTPRSERTSVAGPRTFRSHRTPEQRCRSPQFRSRRNR
jgi:hemerythrin